jgi:hypothetical protein
LDTITLMEDIVMKRKKLLIGPMPTVPAKKEKKRY